MKKYLAAVALLLCSVGAQAQTHQVGTVVAGHCVQWFGNNELADQGAPCGGGGGGGSPGGTNGQIQFNNAGAFGGVTAVLPANGGTGDISPSAHSVMIAEGASPMNAAAGGTNCLLLWSLITADPTCATALPGNYSFTGSPTFANPLALGSSTATTQAQGTANTTLATTAYADRTFSATEPGAVPLSGGGTSNFLRADGAWAVPTGGGVSITAADGSIVATPSTITGTGTLTVGLVPVAKGGTGATAAGVTAANNIGALAEASNLSDLASAATARTNLGLGTAATVNTGMSGSTLCILSGAACTFGTFPVFPVPSGDILVGNVSGNGALVALSGDATLSNAGALTLDTVNSNVGSFGGVNSIPSFTVNAKGLVTAAAANVPAIPFTELTGSLALTQIAAVNSNTIIANPTAASLAPQAQAVPSCSAAADALIWTSNTGIGCNTAIVATSATAATNLSGGAANDIPFQSAASTSTFITPVNGAVVNTSSSGVPGETATPVLGVNGIAKGTLGLATSVASGATTTLQPASPTTAATITLPSISSTLATLAANTYTGTQTFADGGTWGSSGIAGSAVAATTLSASTNAKVTGTSLPTQAAGTLGLGGVSTTPTFGATGEGDLWLSSTLGLVDGGEGSTNDRTWVNSAGTTVANIPTGTTNFNIPGALLLPSTANGALKGGIGTPNAPWFFSNSASSTALPTFSNPAFLTSIADGSSNGINLAAFGTGNVPRYMTYSSLGTLASPTAVTSGTTLANNNFFANDGTTTPAQAAQIMVAASENYSSTNHGASLNLKATPIGSGGALTTYLTLGGPVPGVATAGHVTNTQIGAIPAVSTCGTGTPTVTAGSSDRRGSVTTGTAATSCTITFTTAYATAPFCVVSANSAVAIGGGAPSTTAFTTTMAALSGGVITWICEG